MFRMAYRNFGDHESLVDQPHRRHVDGVRCRTRWYEIRNPGGLAGPSGGVPVVYQQGTYAPDSNWRWMGSIAQDTSGNIALGYSISSPEHVPLDRHHGTAFVETRST